MSEDDRTEDVQAALDLAANGYSVKVPANRDDGAYEVAPLILPPGEYRVGGELRLPPGVELRGYRAPWWKRPWYWFRSLLP